MLTLTLIRRRQKTAAIEMAQLILYGGDFEPTIINQFRQLKLSPKVVDEQAGSQTAHGRRT